MYICTCLYEGRKKAREVREVHVCICVHACVCVCACMLVFISCNYVVFVLVNIHRCLDMQTHSHTRMHACVHKLIGGEGWRWW